MKRVYKIEGGHPLRGTVHISGAKNATVALIPAAILAKEGTVTICDLPDISDVEALLILLNELNVKTELKGRDLSIDVSDLLAFSNIFA